MIDIARRFWADMYPSKGEWAADGLVHGLGLLAALVAGLLLFVWALVSNGVGQATAVAVYALGVLAMLGCSAIYNLTPWQRIRPLLRRLDHSAIMILIAASYTPFTTQRLEGWWAVSMTAVVWALATAGVFGRIFLPEIRGRWWSLFYVGFGWVAIVAFRPFSEGVSLAAMILLAVGGLIYTAGVPIYHSRWPFRRAVWHGFVVAAAAVHWAAVLVGVVLAPAS